MKQEVALGLEGCGAAYATPNLFHLLPVFSAQRRNSPFLIFRHKS